MLSEQDPVWFLSEYAYDPNRTESVCRRCQRDRYQLALPIIDLKEDFCASLAINTSKFLWFYSLLLLFNSL